MLCNTIYYLILLSRFLQFTLRLGSKSVLSTCKAPDQPGEGVLLHYSYDNGITWKLLEHYSYLNYHEARYTNYFVGNKYRRAFVTSAAHPPSIEDSYVSVYFQIIHVL